MINEPVVYVHKKKVEKRKTYIVGIIFVVVTLCTLPLIYFFSVQFNIIPSELLSIEEHTSVVEENNVVSPTDQTATATIPVRVIARSAQIDAPVVFPDSTDLYDLNTALTRGSVYYPGSGTVAGGNIFLFGHSTSFDVVRNNAYKIFNGISTLSTGDIIEVHTADAIYLYSVDNVRKTLADEAYVQFNTERDMVTLSTCNVFGSKDERFVAEALLLGRAL
jgi:LPXTG-site transpeptidase (sortase) family protein